MGILIVEDSVDTGLILQKLLQSSGYPDAKVVHSALEAFKYLGIANSHDYRQGIDLILLDILMPDIDGISACRRIKEDPHYHDVPVIMVTATSMETNLERAFAAGAMDFIGKPFQTVELLARVRSALRLKGEIDTRKSREAELRRANAELLLLSSQDGLTGIANRRHFDETLDMEWKRAIRNRKPISLLMIDIDFFKDFNDSQGHLPGDDCLKGVARALAASLKRPADFLTRYGGEEFAVILPETDLEGAELVAQEMRQAVQSLGISHPASRVAKVVTISVGAGCLSPDRGQSSRRETLIALADGALLEAKRQGRNRVHLASS